MKKTSCNLQDSELKKTGLLLLSLAAMASVVNPPNAIQATTPFWQMMEKKLHFNFTWSEDGVSFYHIS